MGKLDQYGAAVRQLVGSPPPLRLLDMEDLAPIPGVTQAPIPRYRTDRPPTPLQESFKSRMRTVERDVDRGMEAGSHRWYHAEPVRQQFIAELGEEAGNEQYNLFADMVAGSSSAADVVSNIRKASWYRQNALEGLLPAGELERYADARSWIKANKPPPGYGSVAQINDAMWTSRFLDGPQVWRASRPGEAHKIISFNQNLRGNLAPWTGDRHEAARLGVPATRNKKGELEKGQFTPNDYVAAEDLMVRLAGRKGLLPAELQSARWMGGGRMTGVKSADPSFAHALETAVFNQADRTGRSPNAVLRDFIRNAGLLSTVPAAASMAEGE